MCLFYVSLKRQVATVHITRDSMSFLTRIQNPGGPGSAQFLPNNMQNGPHLNVSVVSLLMRKDQLTKLLEKERTQGM